MASSVAASGLARAAALAPQFKGQELRNSGSVARTFQVKPSVARTTCSAERNVQQFVKKVAEAGKVAGVAAATSLLLAQVSSSGIIKSSAFARNMSSDVAFSERL
jgi:hypothetical protein